MEQHFISTAGTLKMVSIRTLITEHNLYSPMARVLCFNPIGIVFKLLYINIFNDSPYFRCPDGERFYPFEIFGFRKLKLYLFRVAVFAFNTIWAVVPSLVTN